MSDSDLHLLPPDLSRLSVNDREIALPYPAVVAAIEHLERTGVRILGWEALQSSVDGGPPYTLLQGSGDLASLSKEQAATVTRRQIERAMDDPNYWSDESSCELYFIITVDAT